MEDLQYQKIADNYLDIVYRATLSYCKNQHDAQDAVQNTFIKLLQSDIKFKDEEHIRRWLIRVAVNECKNMWSSFWHKNVTYIEELNEEPKINEESHREIFDEVMRLPKKYSIVVHLYYYEGYSVAEIAEILGISQTNVQTRLMRARGKLKEKLKEA